MHGSLTSLLLFLQGFPYLKRRFAGDFSPSNRSKVGFISYIRTLLYVHVRALQVLRQNTIEVLRVASQARDKPEVGHVGRQVK